MSDDDEILDLEGLDDEEEETEESSEADATDDADEAEEAESAEESADEKDMGRAPSAFDHYLASPEQADDFLAQEDPEFARSLKALEDIPKGPEDSEDDSIDLDSGMLKEESVKFNAIIQKFEKLLKPYYFVKGIFGFVFYRFSKVFNKSKEWCKWAVTDGREVIFEKVKLAAIAVKTPIVNFVLLLKKMGWKGRLLFFFLISGSFFVLASFSTLIKGNFLPHTTAQTVKSFDEVADRLFIIDSKRGLEAFDSPIRHSQYVVLLKSMSINILPSPGSGDNPMGLFAVYVEGTNQEVAVEIKDREVELLDRFQRIVEAMSFAELQSTEGKLALKKSTRRVFNQILNKGRAKRIYFRLISLKP